MNGIHEVTGSIPVWSTNLSFSASVPNRELAVKKWKKILLWVLLLIALYLLFFGANLITEFPELEWLRAR